MQLIPLIFSSPAVRAITDLYCSSPSSTFEQSSFLNKGMLGNPRAPSPLSTQGKNLLLDKSHFRMHLMRKESWRNVPNKMKWTAKRPSVIG